MSSRLSAENFVKLKDEGGIFWSEDMGLLADALNEYANLKWKTYVRLLMNIVGNTDKPEPGIDPTFYITGNYESDLEIWKQVQEIKELIEEEDD